MERRGVVAAETISVLLTKPVVIVLCLRHQAPTPLWGPCIHSGPTGQMSADFSNHPGSDRFWKVNKHGAFSIPRKTIGLRRTDQSCPSRNMASSRLCLTGAIPGPEKTIMNGTFLSKNDLQIAHTGPKTEY